MDFPLLQTKLYIPTPRPDFVSRPRLIEKLNHGHSGKLTCVAAPAGFGKTTLVSDWLHQLELPVGWLSLDERDNDLTRFLTYLIAALQEVDQAIGKATQKLLQSTQAPNSPLPPPETLFTTFITEISAAGANLVLALDDYHFITDQAIHKAMGFFLDHLPPSMHLVITTRHDPGFPLSRLRVKGQLMEIGIDDLRFSPEETAEFLNRAEGLALSDEEIAILEHRTEGWITGLRLAALSAKDYKYSREATGKFIDAFAGDDRMVADYLMDEVLAQRPKDMQVFLLQASILDRFCGSLCNAVCSDDAGGAQGQEMLAQLDQANLFVIPLDSQRQWYRFHKLFADFLRQRLDWVYPEQIAVLHDRAAHWYEANDVIPEAIDHFLAARDFENAARLVE